MMILSPHRFLGKSFLVLFILFPSFNTVFCLHKWVLKSYSDHEIKREEIFSPPKQQSPKGRKKQCCFSFKKLCWMQIFTVLRSVSFPVSYWQFERDVKHFEISSSAEIGGHASFFPWKEFLKTEVAVTLCKGRFRYFIPIHTAYFCRTGISELLRSGLFGKILRAAMGYDRIVGTVWDDNVYLDVSETHILKGFEGLKLVLFVLRFLF